jgi:hypothetical protein
VAEITIGRVLDKDTDSISSFEKHILVPEEYDHMDLSYTAGKVSQVVYRQGGPGGTIVATLTLGYTSGLLSSVTRT